MESKIYPNHIQIIGLFFILFLFSFAGIIGFIPYLIFENAHTYAFGITITYVIGFILTLRYAINNIRKNEVLFSINESFDFNLNARVLVILVIATIAFIFYSNYFINIFHFKDQSEEELNKLIKSPVIAFFSIAIFPPILEELFFRGIILQQLFKRYSAFIAILISALYFGLFHLNPPQILNAFMAGCFIGWIYYKTKNLFYTILIHFINNVLAWVALFLTKNFPENRSVIQFDQLDNNLTIAIICFAVFLICIYFLNMSFKKLYPINAFNKKKLLADNCFIVEVCDATGDDMKYKSR